MAYIGSVLAYCSKDLSNEFNTSYWFWTTSRFRCLRSGSPDVWNSLQCHHLYALWHHPLNFVKCSRRLTFINKIMIDNKLWPLSAALWRTQPNTAVIWRPTGTTSPPLPIGPIGLVFENRPTYVTFFSDFKNMTFYVFTCTQCTSAKRGLAITIVCPSVCPSLTLVDHDHIGLKSWKLIVRTISPNLHRRKLV